MARSLLALSSAPRLVPSRSPAPAHLRGLRCATGRRRRGAVTVRAGGPSTNSLILAFVLPLSLLAGTIFTAARIADRLDEQYLEEVVMNQAIMEESEAAMGDGDGGEGEEVATGEKEEVLAAAPRARNRPRRKV